MLMLESLCKVYMYFLKIPYIFLIFEIFYNQMLGVIQIKKTVH